MNNNTQALIVSVEIDLNDEALQAREVRLLEAFVSDLIRAVINAEDGEE